MSKTLKQKATVADITYIAMTYGVLNLLENLRNGYQCNSPETDMVARAKFDNMIKERQAGFELLLDLANQSLVLGSQNVTDTIDRLAKAICRHFKITVEEAHDGP